MNKTLINRHFLTNRGGYRRLLSIGVSALLSISTFLTVIPQTQTTVYAAGSGKNPDKRQKSIYGMGSFSKLMMKEFGDEF